MTAAAEGSEPAPGHLVALSLGANLGDREATIHHALELLDALPHSALRAVSALYSADPVGVTDQPEFINCSALLETELEPQALLSEIRKIERVLGRRERPRWHEREIDIDILLVDDLRLESEDLRIPHPEMAGRRFVLQPLAEIAPEMRMPESGNSIAELLARLPPLPAVRRIE